MFVSQTKSNKQDFLLISAYDGNELQLSLYLNTRKNKASHTLDLRQGVRMV
jgi:hypothetical protein